MSHPHKPRSNSRNEATAGGRDTPSPSGSGAGRRVAPLPHRLSPPTPPRSRARPGGRGHSCSPLAAPRCVGFPEWGGGHSALDLTATAADPQTPWNLCPLSRHQAHGMQGTVHLPTEPRPPQQLWGRVPSVLDGKRTVAQQTRPRPLCANCKPGQARSDRRSRALGLLSLPIHAWGFPAHSGPSGDSAPKGAE